MAKTKKEVIKKVEKTVLAAADMTVSELLAKTRELKQEINKKRLDLASGRIKNVREIFNLRKQLARVKTSLVIKMRLNEVKSKA